ncbi:hypothetical protein DM860_000821 [Cuscuta australis]|uniref:Uncharacterized protein n=1 Tax=Cuscuta australis TaxID=267555 RepID=A0A328CX94_9ASTE|nr:hypothetical protein DM860_000821 [Cuscuta australis]
MCENYNNICSKGNVPFSWETKPGISKVLKTVPVFHPRHHNLPPPPCVALTLDGSQILPQVPRNSSKKVVNKHDNDPFLVAYMECTKNDGSRGTDLLRFSKDDRVDFGTRKRKTKMKKKNFGLFTCRDSRGVIEDKTVKVSRLPVSKSQKKGEDICVKSSL